MLDVGPGGNAPHRLRAAGLSLEGSRPCASACTGTAEQTSVLSLPSSDGGDHRRCNRCPALPAMESGGPWARSEPTGRCGTGTRAESGRRRGRRASLPPRHVPGPVYRRNYISLGRALHIVACAPHTPRRSPFHSPHTPLGLIQPHTIGRHLRAERLRTGRPLQRRRGAVRRRYRGTACALRCAVAPSAAN